MGIYARPALENPIIARKSVATNVTWQNHRVSRTKRGQAIGKVSGFRGCTIWMTGLSGAGKTSLSFYLEHLLISNGIAAYGLDGDNIRTGLSRNLSFGKEDREENVRRVAEVAKLLADSGLIALCSFVSPFDADRRMARRIHEEAGLRFFEVFVDAPLSVCEARDVKGLYKKARQGTITSFTGIDQTYERPTSPDFVVDSANCDLDTSAAKLIEFLEQRGIVPKLLRLASHSAHELFVSEPDMPEIEKQARDLESLEIREIDLQWIQILAEGWAAPLEGFMREKQYLQCLHFNHLFENELPTNQSIAIVLAASTADKERLQGSSAISLTYAGKNVAILKNPEFYFHHKKERCSRQFGTNSTEHPYVKIINDSGDWLVGGDLEVIYRIKWNDGLDHFRLTPKEIKSKCRELGADAVIAFQPETPLHNGHVLFMQDTRRHLIEECGFKKPIFLLHPLGGWRESEDMPLNVRIQQYQVVLEDSILHQDTILAIFPSPMIYAGSIEMQWFAKARMNAGANFCIIGDDPSSISESEKSSLLNGDFNDSTRDTKVLSTVPGLRNCEIISFRATAYDKKLERMTFVEPQRSQDYEFISGTKMRALARTGEKPPGGFMPAKAWEVLAEYYKSLE